MRIYHVTPRSAWTAALRSGRFEAPGQQGDGSLTAARRDQVTGMLADYQRDTEPVVVLEIETDLLDVPWEEVEAEGTTYPRVLAPFTTRAVLDVLPGHLGYWSEGGRRPMAPPAVQVFGGLGLVLGLASLVLLVASLIAHHKAHPADDLPATISHSTEFLLWSLTAAGAVAATTASCLATSLSNAYRRRTAWRP